MKNILLPFLLILPVTGLLGQKKNTLKDEAISSKTEWIYVIKNGAEVKQKEAEYKYDQDGNVTIEKTYDAQGMLKDHFEYTYDSEGNQTSQLTYNSKNSIIKREVYTYKGKLKTEKKTFGPNGKLISRKVYEYKTF